MSRPAHMKMNTTGRRMALRLLTAQMMAAGLLILIFWGISGGLAALHATAGAVVGLVPSAIFALLAFRFAGAHAAPSVVTSFFAGAVLKLMLSIVLMIVALLLLDGPLLPLFVVFALIHMMQLLAPILLLKTN